MALAVLLKAQLTSFPEVKAANAVHIHPVDFGARKLNNKKDVKQLKGELEEKLKEELEGEMEGQRDLKVHIILDEVDWIVSNPVSPYTRWITAVRKTMPDAVVWMAGLRDRGSTTSDKDQQLPPWVDTVTLNEPLRTPPCVTFHVAEAGGVLINNKLIPSYSASRTPQHAQGVARKIRHEGKRGHYRLSGVDEWRCYLNCEACAVAVSDVMKSELRVGQTGGPQCRDVWVLRGEDCRGLPRKDDAFVKHLRKHFTVTVVETDNDGVPRTEAGATLLALAAQDSVVVTDYRAVNGMERSVVFVLGGGWTSSDIEANSRSTSFVCQIE